MNNTNVAHDFETIELLYGKIVGTKYTTEVLAVLKEWGIDFDAGYIRWMVTNRHKAYNERIWDAITEVIKRRKERREYNAELAKQLVASN